MKLSRLASIAAVFVCALAVASCANTVRGVKRDLNNTANAVQE
ncbi:MAG: EncA/B family entericidin [Rhizobiales bacterium]|nr:EncA/B family entericidin [Hyphomicrobiales bacterium]